MEKDHLNLLCSVNELSSILAGSSDISSFLDQIVETICTHIRTDVCSIYLYDETTETLSLKATHGLNRDAADEVFLKLGEGLVGTALKTRRPICEAKASENPNYRHFSELDEEEYEAFLAVPIRRGLERIGVLVLQRKESDPFGEHDILALQGTASLLANVVENVRVMLSLDASWGKAPAQEPSQMELIKGMIASPGICFSKAEVIDREEDHWAEIPGEDKYLTVEEFQQVVTRTVEQLEELENRLEAKLPEMASMIFGAHAMILKDHEFTGRMEALIENGSPAGAAVLEISEHYIKTLALSQNAYIREKVEDVKDLAKRILANIFALDDDLSGQGYDRKIIISRSIFPSDLLMLSSYNVGGIILAQGGITSHIAILARSMNIPMIISAEPKLLELKSGTPILLDGGIGNIYINPSAQVQEQFREHEQRHETVRAAAVTESTTTRCGHPIHIRANVNLLNDTDHAINVKSEGVGLYRTEFPFLIRTDFPSESDQINIYHYLLDKMDGQEITFRTLDVGGDKTLTYFHHEHEEENPVLGMRSIRFSYEYPDIFVEQLRAILRAARGHENVRIMFPMISSIEEFEYGKRMIQRAFDEMDADGVPHQKNVKLGMMVEVPSVIPIIDELAEIVDFLCIGTNDLIQLMLAVDRNNEKVQKYFVPEHPSILRVLAKTAEAAVRNNISVSVCGEIAHMPRFAAFLIGIGIDSLSVDPQYRPALQAFISNVSYEDCCDLAQTVLKESKLSRIRELLDEFHDRHC